MCFQDELKEYGRKKGWCPYFVARHAVSLYEPRHEFTNNVAF